MGMQDRKETTGQGRSMQDTLRQVQRTLDGRGTRGKRKVESKGRTVAARTAGLVIHTQEPEPVADESILEKVQMLTKRIGGRTTEEQGITIKHPDGRVERIQKRKTVQRPTIVERSKPVEKEIVRVEVPVPYPVPVYLQAPREEPTLRVKIEKKSRRFLLLPSHEVLYTDRTHTEIERLREQGTKVDVIEGQYRVTD